MEKIKSRFRRAVFVVVYSRDKKGKIEYLILKRKLHWKGWEFPKGGLKRFETKRHAIKRETKEETGQKAFNIKKYNLKGKYRYNKIYDGRPGIIGQSWELYSTEIKNKKIKLDKLEHSEYKWANFKESMKKLTWPNQRKSLRTVNKWVSRIK